MQEQTFRSSRAKAVRVADTITSELRERILSGDLLGALPKQEELMQMFGVSGPSLREALRILETEGLVTVRRGKFGGAEIHRPDGGSVAHSIGLTLQGEGTHLRELADALLAFEPTCASACAGGEGRLGELCPMLEENLEKTAASVGDGPEFTRLSRDFHAIIVGNAPNTAVRLMVRSLVVVWSIQEETWASEAEEHGRYPDLDSQQAALKAHRRIAQSIREGDTVVAERIARSHLSATQQLMISQSGDRIVDAASPRATEGFRRMSSARNRRWVPSSAASEST